LDFKKGNASIDDMEELGIMKDMDSSSEEDQQSDSEDIDIHMNDRSK
jgi:hypothetical protein